MSSVAVRALQGACRAWQVARAGRPSPCRFHPTCSQYAIDAFAVHGARRGLWLTAKRIGRCNPWGPYGFDPVPSAPSASPPVDPSPHLASHHLSGPRLPRPAPPS